MYSDASSYARGALIQGTEQFISHTMFTDQERSLSSTHRELITIYYSLQAFEDKLFDVRVKWFTDNQATARIVDVGSMKLQLHHLAYKIFSYCFQHNIDLHVQWIPRDLNTQADFVSKIRDCDDWQLTSQCSGILERTWGPHSLDCFASYYSAKTPRFFSRFWNPGTPGVDALFQSWEGENCLVVPPVSIITRVLSYIRLQNVAVTLVVPVWPSASFWPLLGQRYSLLIKEYHYFRDGRALRSLIGSNNWNGYIITVRLVSTKS